MTGPVDVIRSAVDALNRGDVDGYLDHIHPDGRRWIVGIDQPLTLGELADGLRQLQQAFDPLRLDTESLFGEGRLVCARWRLRGAHVREFMGFPAWGRAIDVPQCEVYELEGDRVMTVWTYGDAGELIRQLAPPGGEPA